MATTAAAVTREQGVEFTVVSVRPAVASSFESDRAVRGLLRYFPGRPIVLAVDVGGRVKFVGRRDLVQWLATSRFRSSRGRPTGSPTEERT